MAPYLLVEPHSIGLLHLLPSLGKAAHCNGALDEDGQKADEHDDRLEAVRPQHRLHPSLHTSHVTRDLTWHERLFDV